MSVPLTINGVTFSYPQQFDVNWGPTLTNWSTAVTNGMLQKAGGTFTLTAETDFGASFGLKALLYKSKETNIAATGILRLANASAGVVWRNALNNADLPLTVNASNQLTFNGTSIGATTSLTDGHILVGNASNQPADVAMSGDITITNAGVTSIASGTILNADINASAAIDVSKLAALTASKLAVTDGSGFLTTLSAPSLTEVGYVTGVTSAIQTQINAVTTAQGNYLPLAGGTMSGAISMGSHKVTSLTAASATGDAISYQQTGGAVVGSTANTGGTQGTLSQGTVSTPDFRANAVTLTSTSNGAAGTAVATTITSTAITTLGGKVLITATASIGLVSATILSHATASTNIILDRDGTAIADDSFLLTMNNSANTFVCVAPLTITCIDSPAAGAHTYKLSYSTSSGSSVNSYNLSVVELRA